MIPFYSDKEDKDFRDVAGAMASAFNTLRFEPDKGMDTALQTIKQQRTAKRAKNKTVEYLRSLGQPESTRLADMVETGQLTGQQAYIQIFALEQEKRAADRAAANAARSAEAQKAAAELAFERQKELYAYKAGIDAQKPSKTTPTAFEAQMQIYRTAYPDLNDAEILDKMNEEKTPSKIKAIELAIERSGIDPNSDQAKMLYATMGEGVSSYYKAMGGEAGKQQVDLAGAAATVKLADQVVEDILKDPYLSSMTGPIQGRLPNISGDAQRVQSYINQAMGQAYLQARSFLKGGGQITEKEADKAEQAYSRLLNMSVNDEDYIKALNDFRDAVREGYNKIYAQAQVGSQFQINLGSSDQPSAGGSGGKVTTMKDGTVIEEIDG